MRPLAWLARWVHELGPRGEPKSAVHETHANDLGAEQQLTWLGPRVGFTGWVQLTVPILEPCNHLPGWLRELGSSGGSTSWVHLPVIVGGNRSIRAHECVVESLNNSSYTDEKVQAAMCKEVAHFVELPRGVDDICRSAVVVGVSPCGLVGFLVRWVAGLWPFGRFLLRPCGLFCVLACKLVVFGLWFYVASKNSGKGPPPTL